MKKYQNSNNKRIKVLVCIDTLRNAGAQKFVTDLVCNVDKERFDVAVVVTNSLDRSSSFFKEIISHNVRVIPIKSNNHFLEFFEIIRLLRKEKPDIIHSNVGAVLHFAFPVAFLRRKITHLFTVHSMAYRILNKKQRKTIGKYFLKKAIIPVAICDTVQRSICEEFLLKKENVELIYNGVDTNFFLPKKHYDIPKTFINVGTLYGLKRQDFLIDAFCLAHKKNPILRLILVGDGVMKNELETKIRSLGLESSVILAGNQDDVRSFLLNSDVYCCSSKVEGLPISVLEAMSSGLPIITTRAGGVVDIVKDGCNGFVVDDDIELFSAKMLSLIQSKENYASMSLNSRQMAEELDIKKCVEGYQELYLKYNKLSKNDL